MVCRNSCTGEVEGSADVDMLKREAILAEARNYILDWRYESILKDGYNLTFQARQVRFLVP